MPQSKGFIAPLIAIVIIIALGIGGYAFLQSQKIKNENVTSSLPSATQSNTPLSPVPPTAQNPSPAPTPSTVPADWKTYRNEKYGFEFQYPSDWKSPVEKDRRVSIGTATPKNYEGEKLGITISDKGYKTLDQIIVDEGSQRGVSFSGIEKTTLNGSDARSFIDNREGGFTANHLYAIHGSYIYKIGYGNRSSSDPIPETVPQIQKILLTFKFIK